MKKQSNISLRINKELKEIMLRHKISPQHIFDHSLINELLAKKLTDSEREAVMVNAKKIERSRG